MLFPRGGNNQNGLHSDVCATYPHPPIDFTDEYPRGTPIAFLTLLSKYLESLRHTVVYPIAVPVPANGLSRETATEAATDTLDV